MRKRVRNVQNFFKHGLRDLTREIRLPPMLSEIMMFDCVVCCQTAFDAITPLMRLYGARFSTEHADILQTDFRDFFLEGVEINNLAEINRAEFLAKLLPMFERNAGASP